MKPLHNVEQITAGRTDMFPSYTKGWQLNRNIEKGLYEVPALARIMFKHESQGCYYCFNTFS